MRESHARCVRLGRSGDYFEIVTVLNSILSSWLYFSISIIISSLFLALAISSICILLTVLLSFICRLVSLLRFHRHLAYHCFAYLFAPVPYYRSARFVTTGCSLCIFCTILLFSFSLLHFCLDLPLSLLASLTDQLTSHNSPHRTASQQYSCLHRTTFTAFLLFTHTPLASAFFFFFRLFFCPVTLNSIQVLQPSLCAVSMSALFSIVFILLHYPS